MDASKLAAALQTLEDANDYVRQRVIAAGLPNGYGSIYMGHGIVFVTVHLHGVGRARLFKDNAGRRRWESGTCTWDKLDETLADIALEWRRRK